MPPVSVELFRFGNGEFIYYFIDWKFYHLGILKTYNLPYNLSTYSLSSNSDKVFPKTCNTFAIEHKDNIVPPFLFFVIIRKFLSPGFKTLVGSKATVLWSW